MKTTVLSLTALAVCLAVSSCSNSQKTTEVKTTVDSTITSSTIDGQTKADTLVIDTTINAEGTKLISRFDNSKGLATLDLNGEKIDLVQDTMASGVQYHNEHYVYSNWHGETELKKDGKVVFKSKK
jgi:membrane-bound inhibitor of C-type lysozyme